MNFWQKLEKPFFVLAPMDDVTDTAFRQLVARCAPPDVYFTEFASVDGLQSSGQRAVEQKLRFTEAERPLVAQVWGIKPANFEISAQQLVARRFNGIDLNMGCPVKKVVSLGACSALMENRQLATEIIQATQQGAGKLPVSIKTRLGKQQYDESWLAFLLQYQPTVLTVHLRTVSEMSAAPAHWELAGKIVELRDKISPETLLVGNGDVLSRSQARQLANRHGLDGVMIGRGILHDPFAFAEVSSWPELGSTERLKLYLQHVELFETAWGQTKNPATLKKFAKLYANGFTGAKQAREQIMTTHTLEELKSCLTKLLTEPSSAL